MHFSKDLKILKKRKCDKIKTEDLIMENPRGSVELVTDLGAKFCMQVARLRLRESSNKNSCPLMIVSATSGSGLNVHMYRPIYHLTGAASTRCLHQVTNVIVGMNGGTAITIINEITQL